MILKKFTTHCVYDTRTTNLLASWLENFGSKHEKENRWRNREKIIVGEIVKNNYGNKDCFCFYLTEIQYYLY